MLKTINKPNLLLPDLNIFIQNHYKKHSDDIYEISIDRIHKICEFNAFGATANDIEGSKRNRYSKLYGLTSLANHDKNPNCLPISI